MADERIHKDVLHEVLYLDLAIAMVMGQSNQLRLLGKPATASFLETIGTEMHRYREEVRTAGLVVQNGNGTLTRLP